MVYLENLAHIANQAGLAAAAAAATAGWLGDAHESTVAMERLVRLGPPCFWLYLLTEGSNT